MIEQGRVHGPLARWTGARHATTVLTYLHLRRDGFACELVDAPPDEGILVTHTDFLPHAQPDTHSPWERRGTHEDWMHSLFVVCYQADRPRHPFAQMHLVQNGEDAARNGRSALSRMAGLHLRYVPLWVQPGLLPRDEARGEDFTEVGYFGIPDELDPGMRDPDWSRRLAARGFNLTIAEPAHWNDYRNVDVVVAARSFAYRGKLWRKPPSKLFNAWTGGVPAILGRESAFRCERRSDLDFIEVSSVAEVDAALDRLRDDPRLRTRMVDNGRLRAAEVSDKAITARWREVLELEAFPAYEKWRRATPRARRAWMARRSLGARLENAVGPVLGARRLSGDVLSHRGDWS